MRLMLITLTLLLLSQFGKSQDTDSVFIAQTLDSLNEAYKDDDKSGYKRCDITYSKDEKLKFYVFKGKECGDYCNQLFYGLVKFNDPEKPEMFKVDVTEIDFIYSFGENRYIIIQSYWGQANSTETITCQSALTIEYDDKSIYPVKAFYRILNGETSISEKLHFCTSEVVDIETYLNYNRYDGTLNLRYQTYTRDTYNQTGTFDDVTESFMLRNDLFVLVSTHTRTASEREKR